MSEDKTESPTQKRLDKAREDGDILKSKELGTALVVLAGCGWLAMFGPSLVAACKAVMTASFRPGDRTVFHTHRHPVTVYVLEGTFTLEMEGRAPVLVRAGEALVEPPGVRMTGYNRAEGPLRVLIVYVAEPGTPFLDPIH